MAANVDLIERAAIALGPLLSEVTFVGGARPTNDLEPAILPPLQNPADVSWADRCANAALGTTDAPSTPSMTGAPSNVDA